MGENQTKEIVIILELQLSLDYDGMVDWPSGPGRLSRGWFVKVRISKVAKRVFNFFEKLPNFKGPYLFCAKFRDFRTFTM